MKEITAQQKKVLEFIHGYICEYSHPPSFREIMKGMNLNSTNAVKSHIDALVDKGYVRTKFSMPRTICMTGKALNLLINKE